MEKEIEGEEVLRELREGKREGENQGKKDGTDLDNMLLWSIYVRMETDSEDEKDEARRTMEKKGRAEEEGTRGKKKRERKRIKERIERMEAEKR